MKRTSPLILASIPLVVDPLLDDVLVLGIVGVDDLDRLPTSLALGRIAALEGKASEQRGESQALRIHTRRHQLLRAAEVPVPVYKVP